MNQDEWELMGRRQEQLHPNLAEYLMESPIGLRLNHPLVQEPAVDPNYAAQVKLRYHEKIKAIDEAIEQRDRCFSQLGVDQFLGQCAVAPP